MAAEIVVLVEGVTQVGGVIVLFFLLDIMMGDVGHSLIGLLLNISEVVRSWKLFLLGVPSSIRGLFRGVLELEKVRATGEPPMSNFILDGVLQPRFLGVF